MNDDAPRNTIEPDGPSDRAQSGLEMGGIDSPGMAVDRGMPALGQYRRARPRAWWLTPIVIVLMVGAGAVWTVHGFLARHDADAKAHRDAVADTSTQGRVFKDGPTPAVGVAAAAPLAASAIAVRPVQVPGPGTAPEPVGAVHIGARRSYYDAPLLAVGDAGGQDTAAAEVSGVASSVVATVSGGIGPSGERPAQAGSTLAQALSPTATPRVRAGMLGNRSLMLAQGAKIDCVGDTAFDSTDAGMSTCTVTKNVYSDDGRLVLIERGSQINSEYRSNLSPGQKRIFVLSALVKTPLGVTVEIDSPVADALGRMGIDGFVDNHWRPRVGAAVMLGITQDAIGYLATRGGNSNGSVVYANTQQQGNDMATHVLDSTINIPPTLTKNQGAEFSIVIARDLDFGSVYALQPEFTP
ncbi:Type IV secretion system protein virB10 [Paraburkholderia domus]|uniref:type IV secretion system protein VirB10 n=1 Tax=Paraburkholderia domus TaxID=2793075 RepID=UPI0019119CE2|nr:type IV secretion system protein VirB10 [Paraburkholderia domus]MBK5054443.1 type IV secretion system protein VirB10 [Burkholderia sp. R-70006]CAE6861027.1 Type IV secretion system protein virB10 [Paraburkholderia domus]